MANELQQKQPQKMTFSMAINSTGYQKLINNVIKDPAKRDRFISSITSAVAINPALQECDPSTILSGALLGESLGLSPSPQLGQYYLVPYLDKKNNRTVAQFQLGYKGYVQLALRSGYYRKLNVFSVKAGELKAWNPISEDLDLELIQDDEIREKTASIGYVATFEYTNGFRKTIYWSKQKMEAHALRFSKGYAAKKGYTFWEKDFDAMAYKTMLRQLISKWGIMSIELQKAFEQDVIVDDSSDYLETAQPSLAPVTEAPSEIDSGNSIPETPQAEQGEMSLDDL